MISRLMTSVSKLVDLKRLQTMILSSAQNIVRGPIGEELELGLPTEAQQRIQAELYFIFHLLIQFTLSIIFPLQFQRNQTSA